MKHNIARKFKSKKNKLKVMFEFCSISFYFAEVFLGTRIPLEPSPRTSWTYQFVRFIFCETNHNVIKQIRTYSKDRRKGLCPYI